MMFRRIGSPTSENAPSPRTFSARVRWILAAALLARIAVLVYAQREPQRFDFPDSHRYAAVAKNIAEGRGPIESPAQRTGTDPLFPLFLAPAWWIPNASVQTIFVWSRLLNLLFGLGLVAAVTAMTADCFGPRAATVAGLIAAFDPILLFFHGLPLTEIVYSSFLWMAILMLTSKQRARRLRTAATAGILLGLSVLARSSGLPIALAALVVITAVKLRHATGSPLQSAAIAATVLALALLPEAMRHHRLIGAWSPLRTGSGATLLESFGPWADGGPGMEKVAWPAVPPDANEAQRDRIYREAALAWARDHPRESMDLALRKLARTWSVTMNAPGYGGTIYRIIGWCTVAPVYLLALAALLRHGRRRCGILLILLTPALCVTLMHMVYVGSVRYRVPVMPGVFILAGAAVAPRDPDSSREPERLAERTHG